MRQLAKLLVLPIIPLALAVCSDSTDVTPSNPSVSMLDECDPTTFNAALGAGTCARQGSVTFAQFNAQLATHQSVNEWRFDPTALTIRVGQSIRAMNAGGELHTFTEVEDFGGGIVPTLNIASGNPVEAPECKQLAASAMVAPGKAFATDAATEVGTEHYQCCIHPWMRATVTVTQ